MARKTCLTPRVALLCQFKDPDAYLPCFHAHHARLADQIFYLDHCSKKDYRSLNLDNATFYRTNISNFVKDLFISRIIQDLRVQYDFDFLFILDIDEYILFSRRVDFHDFLNHYINIPVGTLYWRNGYPNNFENLRNSPKIFVQKDLQNTKKLFYNLRLLRNFFPKEGNHNADYSFLGQTYLQFRPRREKIGAALIHLPLVSKEQILQKFEEFPHEHFSEKFHFKQEINQFSELNNEFINIVGNYRSGQNKNYALEDFEIISLFDEIRGLIQKNDSLVKNLKIQYQELETMTDVQVGKLRKPDFWRDKRLMRQLIIDPDRTLRLEV